MESGSAGRKVDAGGAVEVFPYPACPGADPLREWSGWEEAPGCDGDDSRPAHRSGRTAVEADGPGIAEENRQAFEAGRKRGYEEGRTREREAHAAGLQAAEERSKRDYAKLMADFAAASERYLGAMEREVVNLALAVAKRILRREAQMDPLLLTGAVRVALGQLAANSEVRLRIPDAQAELWREAMALVPNRSVKPVVVADAAMRLGDCVIESQAGSVDLGVRSQLDEIERRFFDRASAGAQPAAGSQESAASGAEK